MSILESQQSGEQVTCEFRLLRTTARGPEMWDLMVTSTPIQVEGRGFRLFVLHEVDARVAVKTYDV